MIALLTLLLSRLCPQVVFQLAKTLPQPKDNVKMVGPNQTYHKLAKSKIQYFWSTYNSKNVACKTKKRILDIEGSQILTYLNGESVWFDLRNLSRLMQRCRKR